MKNMRFISLALLLVSASIVRAADFTLAEVINEDFRSEAERFFALRNPNKAELFSDRLKRLAVGVPRKNTEMDDPGLTNLYDAVERMLELTNQSKHTQAVSLTSRLEQRIVEILINLPQAEALVITPAPDTWSIYDKSNQPQDPIGAINSYISGLKPAMSVVPKTVNLAVRSAADRLGGFSSRDRIISAPYLNFESFASSARDCFAGGRNKELFAPFSNALLDDLSQSAVEAGSPNWQNINHARLFVWHLLIAAGYDVKDLVEYILEDLQNCTAGDQTMVEAFNIVLNDDIKRLLYGSKLLEGKDVCDSYLQALRELATKTVERNASGERDPVYTELQSVYNCFQIHIIKRRLIEISAKFAAARGDSEALVKYLEEQRLLKAAQSAKRAAAIKGYSTKLEGFTSEIGLLIEKRTTELSFLVEEGKSKVRTARRTPVMVREEGREVDAVDWYFSQVNSDAQTIKAGFESFIKDDLEDAQNAEGMGNEDDFLAALNPRKAANIEDRCKQAITNINGLFDLRQKSIGALIFDACRKDQEPKVVNAGDFGITLSSFEQEMQKHFVRVSGGANFTAIKDQLKALSAEDDRATASSTEAFDPSSTYRTSGDRLAAIEELEGRLGESPSMSAGGGGAGWSGRMEDLEAARVASSSRVAADEPNWGDGSKVSDSQEATMAGRKKTAAEDEIIRLIRDKKDLKASKGQILRLGLINGLLDNSDFQRALNGIEENKTDRVISEIDTACFLLNESGKESIKRKELYRKLCVILGIE